MTSEAVFRDVEACPWCSGTDLARIATRVDQIPVMRCCRCYLAFTGALPDDLGVFYDDEYFARNAQPGPGAITGYESYETSYSPSSFRWLTLILRAVVGERPARLLDIGTATGTFLEMARYEGFDVAGSELNDTGARTARAKGLDVMTGPFDPDDWHPMTFDVITTLEVLEHVTDLRAVLLRIKSLLATDGIFCFFVPNVPDHLIEQYGDGYLDFNKSLEHTLYFNPAILNAMFTEVFGEGSLTLLTKDVPEGDQSVSYALGIVRHQSIAHPVEGLIFDLIEASTGPASLAALEPPALVATAVTAAKFFDFNLAEKALAAAVNKGVPLDQLAPARAQVHRNRGELLRAIKVLLPVAKSTRLYDPLPNSLLIELVEELLPHLGLKETDLDSGMDELLAWVEQARESLTATDREVDLENRRPHLDAQLNNLNALVSEFKSKWEERDGQERKELADLGDQARSARLEADRAQQIAIGLTTTSARLATDKQRLEGELASVYGSRAWRLVSVLRGLKYGVRELLAAPVRLVRALTRAQVREQESLLAKLSSASIRSAPSHLLSVVIPVFNKGWDLVAAIESVMASTLSDIELIVWDDGSTDPATLAALERAAQLPGVNIFRGPNRGVVGARNAAMAAASGHFICCLDPDDRVDPTYFEKAAALLIAEPEVGLAYPWASTTGDKVETWETQDLSPGLITTVNHVPTCAVFRREAYIESGGFSTRMSQGYEDWEFWATLAELGFRGKVIPEPLFHYVHRTSGGFSRDAVARQAHKELAATIQRLHPAMTGSPGTRSLVAVALDLPDLHRVYPQGTDRPIVVTIPWFTVGGADHVVTWLVEHWIERGRTVVVIATEPLGDGMMDKFVELLGVTPYAYKLDNFLPKSDWEKFVAGVLSALDEPILFNVGSPWLYEHLATFRTSVPGLTVVDQQFNEVGHLSSNSRNSRSIDLTIAAYHELANRLLADGRPSESVRTIHVGVEGTREVASSETVKFRSSLGISPEATLVLWVGRLAREKQPEWLVRMAEQLGNDKTRFLMVGDGPLHEELRGRIAGCPWIVWRRHLESLDQAYAAADLVAITSTVEGVPLTLMEALRAGLPVVATGVGGIPDLEHVEGLVLTSPGNYKEMAEQVARLVQSPPGPLKPNDEFGLERMFESYDAVLNAHVPT